MGELDITSKVLLREDPEAFARLLLANVGGPAGSIVDVRPDETVYTATERRLDKVLRVELECDGAREASWIHIEVEAVWRSTVPRRVYRYWSRVRDAHRREDVSSFLIVLKRDTRQRPDPRGTFEQRSRLGTTLRFDFAVIRAWEDLGAEALLRGDADGLLPLLPYAGGATEERVDEAMNRLARVEPIERRAELQTALAVFAGDVFPDVRWIDRIPEEVLMKSTTIDTLRQRAREQGLEQGLEQGREEGRLEVLAGLIERRLGASVRATLMPRLRGRPADVLDRVLTLLAVPRSDEALAAELAELLPPA